MRLLLDTHVFLWVISGDPRFMEQHRHTLLDPANEVFLSVISIWEAIIKHSLGRLPLPAPPGVYLPLQRERHFIETLPLDEGSVAHLPSLPDLHRDPFDRMLVCQAREHELSIVTADQAVAAYPVRILKI